MKGDIMAIKEFLRKLSFEVKKLENYADFQKAELFFPMDDDVENLEVGETHVSITGKLQPEE